MSRTAARMGQQPPRADGREGDPFRGRRKRGNGMDGNSGNICLCLRHGYSCRGFIKEKSRDGGNHHDSQQKQLKEIIT